MQILRIFLSKITKSDECLHLVKSENSDATGLGIYSVCEPEVTRKLKDPLFSIGISGSLI